MQQNINVLIVRARAAVLQANKRSLIPNTIVWHRLNGTRAYADFVIGLANGHKSLTLKELISENEQLTQLVLKYNYWDKNSNGDKRGELLKSIFGKFDVMTYANYTSNFDGPKTLERGRTIVADIFKYATVDATHFAEIRYRLFAHLQQVLLPNNEHLTEDYRNKANALLAGYVFTELSVA